MIGIFDHIAVPSLPIDHPPFFICLQFEFEPSEAGEPMDVFIKLVDDDAKPVVDFTASGEVPRDQGGGPTKLFMQFQLPGIRFERPGDYRLEVLFNGTRVGEDRIPVLVVPQP
jgi:hypothetical protein